MGGRRDKGLSVTRYLTGQTGIAGLTWDGVRGQILAPPPYQIDLTTSRKLQNWHDLLGAELPTTHIAIRYDYGMFRQKLVHGFQIETPDAWLANGNPWELHRPEYTQRVKFGGIMRPMKRAPLSRPTMKRAHVKSSSEHA